MENSLYKIILLPEISLTILTCCCLILGLYSKKDSYLKTINASIFSLTITILLIVVNIDIKFAHYDELFLNNSKFSLEATYISGKLAIHLFSE